MAPLEPWEKVLVSADFSKTAHGELNCQQCHNGKESSDKDTAHQGLIADPSSDPEGMCSLCHAEVTAEYPDSVHASLSGYQVALYDRSTPENHPALDTAYENHCAECHTTCGDCHIAQPDSVGGGLLSGHVFEKTPPMTRTCTACHGSRVGAEYLGQNEGITGDAHFRVGRMNCIACHAGNDLHVTPEDARSNRYHGEQTPLCTDCHIEVGTLKDTNPGHAIHNGKLSCQVCHSVEYSSCDGCHVAISDKTGLPFRTTEGTYLTFFIGRNPLQSEERPYEYVLLRHIPVAETSFQYYGENLLPNFDAVPTWKYATPHNIQRNTPQTASCNTCHGNAALFLTADKVAENELNANQSVIVPEVPAVLPIP